MSTHIPGNHYTTWVIEDAGVAVKRPAGTDIDREVAIRERLESVPSVMPCVYAFGILVEPLAPGVRLDRYLETAPFAERQAISARIHEAHDEIRALGVEPETGRATNTFYDADSDEITFIDYARWRWA